MSLSSVRAALRPAHALAFLGIGTALAAGQLAFAVPASAAGTKATVESRNIGPNTRNNFSTITVTGEGRLPKVKITLSELPKGVQAKVPCTGSGTTFVCDLSTRQGKADIPIQWFVDKSVQPRQKATVTAEPEGGEAATGTITFDWESDLEVRKKNNAFLGEDNEVRAPHPIDSRKWYSGIAFHVYSGFVPTPNTRLTVSALRGVKLTGAKATVVENLTGRIWSVPCSGDAARKTCVLGTVPDTAWTVYVPAVVTGKPQTVRAKIAGDYYEKTPQNNVWTGDLNLNPTVGKPKPQPTAKPTRPGQPDSGAGGQEGQQGRGGQDGGTRADAKAEGELARTGADGNLPLVAGAGAALVAGGAGALLLMRRRRANS